MDAPALSSLTTVAGISLVVTAIEAFLLPALNLSTEASNRFGPLLAVILGIIVALVATFTIVTGVGREDVVSAILNGIFGGLAAIGIHQVATKTALGQTPS